MFFSWLRVYIAYICDHHFIWLFVVGLVILNATLRPDLPVLPTYAVIFSIAQLAYLALIFHLLRAYGHQSWGIFAVVMGLALLVPLSKLGNFVATSAERFTARTGWTLDADIALALQVSLLTTLAFCLYLWSLSKSPALLYAAHVDMRRTKHAQRMKDGKVSWLTKPTFLPQNQWVARRSATIREAVWAFVAIDIALIPGTFKMGWAANVLCGVLVPIALTHARIQYKVFRNQGYLS